MQEKFLHEMSKILVARLPILLEESARSDPDMQRVLSVLAGTAVQNSLEYYRLELFETLQALPRVMDNYLRGAVQQISSAQQKDLAARAANRKRWFGLGRALVWMVALICTGLTANWMWLSYRKIDQSKRLAECENYILSMTQRARTGGLLDRLGDYPEPTLTRYDDGSLWAQVRAPAPVRPLGPNREAGFPMAEVQIVPPLRK